MKNECPREPEPVLTVDMFERYRTMDRVSRLRSVRSMLDEVVRRLADVVPPDDLLMIFEALPETARDLREARKKARLEVERGLAAESQAKREAERAEALGLDQVQVMARDISKGGGR